MVAARVLLADDHALFVEAIVKLLGVKYDIIDTVDNGRALQDAVRKLKPDVVVTDVTMPLMNGLEAVRRLGKEGDMPKVVFLTMHIDIDIVRECFQCGGSAFVSKDRGYDEIVAAIEAVLKNHTYVSPPFPANMAEETAISGHGMVHADPLTTRQREILQLLAEGRSMKEIATIINLSTRTVEWHKYRMMHLLGVQNGAQLVRHALKTKLVM